MDCNACKENCELVSRHTHESDLDRMDRINKRWFIAWLVTFVLLVACVAGFVWYESQWQVVEETTTTEVEQDADNGGNNEFKFVGGDYYGEAEGRRSKSREQGRAEAVRPEEVPDTVSATCATVLDVSSIANEQS